MEDRLSSESNAVSHPVVFFDGVCGLCNRFVDFLLSVDRTHIFRFSTLQGEFAKSKLPEDLRRRSDLYTVVYLDSEGLYTQSNALLRVLFRLGGLWKMTGLLWVVPRVLRDLLYAWVSRNRYHWFGKKEACRVPTAEQSPLFLE